MFFVKIGSKDLKNNHGSTDIKHQNETSFRCSNPDAGVILSCMININIVFILATFRNYNNVIMSDEYNAG